ncbi:MAG: 1-deoxy-D-xylulose-5-phosphate reductoisomerase, partial [Bacilli bacterium]
MRRILLLGASGSIGQQTLDVIKSARDEYQLVAFSLGEKTEMISQIVQEHPNVECICI